MPDPLPPPASPWCPTCLGPLVYTDERRLGVCRRHMTADQLAEAGIPTPPRGSIFEGTNR
jgi:hypothetical protein